MAESEDTSPAIGIDLGTTNCRVGIWSEKDNRFELIPDEHGNYSTPSYVAFTETERLIGDSAKEQVSRNPANTIFDVKRLIGRKFSDLGTDSDKTHLQWPFRVACGEAGKPMIHVEYKGKEKVFSAEEVFSMVLGKLKDLAEIHSGSVVDGASVSVPHCFNSAQRQATRIACSMAGLEPVTLVNEPICAALAYTMDTTRPGSHGEKKVMIFDLGGGSLDVTLFSIEEGVIEVKATSGDSQLGGEDFDLRLLHHFIDEVKQKHERCVASHPRVVRRLKKQVERVKLALSSDMETSIQIDSLLEDFDFYSTISRASFEDMNSDLFAKCIKCVEECLQRAQMQRADVYEVVLVGGSSRIPKVQQLLTEFFGDEAKLNKPLNPEEAVVCGAAVRSGIARGYKAFADYLVVDVAPMSWGVETVGGAMHVMHPRNSSIPTSCEQFFTTCFDDQPGIFIQIYEGEKPRACDNILIATIELSGIPPAPRGEPQILVRFDIDAHGVFTALAKDRSTGQRVEIFMEDIDVASSSVNHDDERRQKLPIQAYRNENPDDSISSSGPRESSNFDESGPHEEFSEPTSTLETRSLEFNDVPPQAVQSRSITVENSSQPPTLAEEIRNLAVKRSDSNLAEPIAFWSCNAVIEENPPAWEANTGNIVESRSQEIVEPPLLGAREPRDAVEQFSEPLREFNGESSINPTEGGSEEFPEKTQKAYGSSNAVENGGGEFSASKVSKDLVDFPHEHSEATSPQVHGLSSAYEIKPREVPEPSPAFRPSGTPESRSEENLGNAEPFGSLLKSTAQPSPRGDLSGPPRVYESSVVVDESRPQECSDQQVYGSRNTVESEPESKSFESSSASKPHKEVEDRQHSEPVPQVHGLSSGYESKQSDLPSAAYRPGSGAPQIKRKSDEFFGPPAAAAAAATGSSSNIAETVSSQEFSLESSSSQTSLLHKIIETTHVIAPLTDFLTHKKECSTVLRRANMLGSLFEELRDSELPFSEAVFACLGSFEAALISAKALLLLCHDGSKFYLILEQRKVAEQFLLVNTALVQALDKLPDSLEISEEVREQVQLVHSQLKRSKGLEDPVDAQLYAELTSLLNDPSGRSPDQLTRLAESFKLQTAGSLEIESEALHTMMTNKDPPFDGALVNQRGFHQIFELLSDLRAPYPPESDSQQSECPLAPAPEAHGSSKVVESSSSQEFSAPPTPFMSSNSLAGSESPQAHNGSRSLEGFSTKTPPLATIPAASYKTSHSFEERSLHEPSETPQVHRSKTFGSSSPHSISEPFSMHRSTSTSESGSQEFSDPSRHRDQASERASPDRSNSRSGSRRHEPSESQSPIYKAWNGLEGRPQAHSEPLAPHKAAANIVAEGRPDAVSTEASPTQRWSSHSGHSRGHESTELSPVYKSSNVSESSRQVSSEQSPSYRSSSTSGVSSEEFSGSGPLRALGELDKPAGAPWPELRRAVTNVNEPLNHSPRAENARSTSCPQIIISDSIIEDVVKKYTWDQILDMTSDLTSRPLGKGGFGAVYLGKLESGKEVAVKILDASSQQGISEFLNEVNLLKRVNHVNLIRLLGYCQDERQVLIYEFAEEGSIWDHLQAKGTSLDWKQRLNIALQSACGLEYLHTGCSPKIIHRDIKSQNILLTKSMVAKVADFGLSKLGADQENISKTHVTTMVKGTLGYLDPEYLKTGQLTEKSDVYSFGVILLEIITGRKPIQNTEKKCFIGDWVEEHYPNGASTRALKTVVDPSLNGHYNPKALKRVVDAAKLCTQPFGSSRPEMTDVVRALRKAQSTELDEKKSSKWLPFRS